MSPCLKEKNNPSIESPGETEGYWEIPGQHEATSLRKDPGISELVTRSVFAIARPYAEQHSRSWTIP